MTAAEAAVIVTAKTSALSAPQHFKIKIRDRPYDRRKRLWYREKVKMTNNTLKLQKIYPTIPENVLTQIDGTLQEILDIQQDIDALQAKIDHHKAQPRCTGRISGRHCIHATGINCPYPRHHRPADQFTPQTRIRASIRQDERASIQAAIQNETQIAQLTAELQLIQQQANYKLMRLK